MVDLTNDVVIHKKYDDFEYIQFRRLLEFPNLKHAYAIKPQNYKTAGIGMQEGDYEKAIENYKNICNYLNLDINKLVKPNQKHTNNVRIVQNIDEMDIAKTYIETDGLITSVNKNVLATCNADCILLLCYDPVKNVIANVHSGWKGTANKIAEVTINKMISEYNCNPKDVICCICPSIRKCHFEVEKDVKDIFQLNFEYTGRIDEIIEHKGKKQSTNGKLGDKWVIDTVLINKILLADCGILQENIIDSGICSVCDSYSIHSCRVEGKDKYGLNSAIIAMI